MSIEDQPTQQIRRPVTPAPMPAPLSPAAAGPVSTESDTSAGAGSTEILSLDDLFESPRAVATQPPAPAAPRIGAVPVSKASAAGNSRGRRGADAAKVWRDGLERSRAWLTSGDNAVIAATAVIAVLLLLAIAVF